MCIRLFPLLVLIFFHQGCATITYTSDRLARDVSECIFYGWRKAPTSGYEAPVSLKKFDTHYFVAVELHPTFPSPIVTGTKHPFHPVWAEVSDVPTGSTTEYHRAYQITHDVIDQVVVDCQGSE